MLRCILAILAVTQFGCVEEGRYFNPIAFTQRGIDFNERLKREMLQLEDLKIGDGPTAAAGRRVAAEITVRYSDGTLVYQGPAVTYWGLENAIFIDNSPRESYQMSLDQTGIALGLNGMAVGGRRRIVVPPNLVCYSGSVGDSLDKGEDPRGTCMLVHSGIQGKRGTKVQKLPLMVEATLTAACRPVFPQVLGFYIGERCRDVNAPERKPADPIWRFYYVAPAMP